MIYVLRSIFIIRYSHVYFLSFISMFRKAVWVLLTKMLINSSFSFINEFKSGMLSSECIDNTNFSIILP
jgi:hypothetical protein